MVMALVFGAGCDADTSTAGAEAEHSAPHVDDKSTENEPALLDAVADIHGDHGPFAVAGYRMGARAMYELHKSPGNRDVEVKHVSPPKHKWSCIADGLQASTGTSVGQLNLDHEVSDGAVYSIVATADGAKTLRFELRDDFIAQFDGIPKDKLPEAGERVATMSDDDIFTFETIETDTQEDTQ